MAQTHLRKSKLMVEYWFCMSAQSAQKKWEACKEAREGQPYKVTPVTASRARETQPPWVSCRAKHCSLWENAEARPLESTWGTHYPLVKGKKSQFYPDPSIQAGRTGLQGL